MVKWVWTWASPFVLSVALMKIGFSVPLAQAANDR